MQKWWLMALLGLSACSSVPTTHTPEAPTAVLPEQWRQSQSSVALDAGAPDLLGLLAEVDVAPLVDLALKQNPNLKQTALRLAESGWITRQRAAERLPQVSLNQDVSRRRQVQGGKSLDTNYSLGLNTSWEWDVWGRLADAEAAAELDQSALAADLLFARRSMAANVIKTWLGWLNARQRHEVENRRLAVLRLNQTIIEQRYRAGLGSLQELSTLRANVEQAVATADEIQQAAQQTERQLQQLLGQFEPPAAVPAQWPVIGMPSLVLPASALGQRPDLLAAFGRIRAADKRSSVAYKNLLPQFSLSLDLSLSEANGGDLLRADPAWSLLGKLSQPLFDGGRREAELEASKLRAEQAYWQYRERLLAAMLEVEKSLDNEQGFGRQQQALEQALQHAKASQDYFERRYRQGLVNILDLLSAQQTTFNIQSRLLQVQLSRVSNRIDLGLALGLPLRQGV